MLVLSHFPFQGFLHDSVMGCRLLVGCGWFFGDLRCLLRRQAALLGDLAESENVSYLIWMISGSMWSGEIFSVATVGFVRKGKMGLVGLPGLISSVLFSHVIEGMWRCPETRTFSFSF